MTKHLDTTLLRNLILYPPDSPLCIVAPRLYGKTTSIMECFKTICTIGARQQHVWMLPSEQNVKQYREMIGQPDNLKVFGFYSSKLLGMRVDGWFILDDCYDNNYPVGKAVDYILRTVLPTLTPIGKLLYIGARWSARDLIRELKYRWVTIELPSNLPETYLSKRRLEDFTGDDLTYRTLFHNDPTPDEVRKKEKS